MNRMLRVALMAIWSCLIAQRAAADTPDQKAVQFGEVMAVENFCNRSTELPKTAFDEWLAASRFEALDIARLKARFLSGYQQTRSVLMEKLDFSQCDDGAASSIRKLNQLIR